VTKSILFTLVAFVAGGAVAKLAWPTIRTKEVQTEVVRNDVRTVVRTVTRPDGSKEIVRETTDKSARTATSTKTVAAPQWVAGLGIGVKPLDLKPVYSGVVLYRVAGPVLLGGYVRTDAELGLQLQVEF